MGVANTTMDVMMELDHNMMFSPIKDGTDGKLKNPDGRIALSAFYSMSYPSMIANEFKA